MSMAGKRESERQAARERASAQCDRLAELLGIDPERVYYSTEGVLLTPSVADILIARLTENTT